MAKGEPQKLSFTVPIFEPHPPQYYIRAVSDSWLRAEAFYTISFQNLQLPEVFICYCSHFITSFFVEGLRLKFLRISWQLLLQSCLK